MDLNTTLTTFAAIGQPLMLLLAGLGLAAGGLGLATLWSGRPIASRCAGLLPALTTGVFLGGFLLICWLHYRVYLLLPLELPPQLAGWLNAKLSAMNQGASYGLPLYDPARPPRYVLPLWIENEKYYFWFFCYAALAWFGYRRTEDRRLQGLLLLLLAIQIGVLFSLAPLAQPLPRFFAETAPWLAGGQPLPERLGLFMQLYPRMIFYYNASYMWFHPPLLFLSYSCLTITFAASVRMLFEREPATERLAYGFAKLAFSLLTLGMLLGYPWALQAWGPNWWWDPKICSSIMLWVVFSTYLHIRLYAHKPGLWYFSGMLGIMSFLAMLFTFLASFYFPGEHTFQ